MAVFFLLANPAAAHRLLMERDGDFFVVRYDDRTPAQGAQVRFYDEGGNELFAGETDREGKIKVPPVRFAGAQADDGLGHRAFYEPGQITRTIPRSLAAVLGVSFFLFVASLANYLNKQKSRQEERKI